ncbi:hypothetical protein B0T14DRAFT_566399 [Immersiella caudata]|uniref:VCBS repeat-containing protein n=1 Tax=Immersiella caudata TaxID=314043 RepID=A0AA39WQA9_9PEZI|nr:hypothetical protein B0T14DRAFT_566399 [Immersiella caudata]
MAEAEVVTNEQEIQRQIEDGGWQIAWGDPHIGNEPGRPEGRLWVSLPNFKLPDFPDPEDVGPGAGVRLWALTQLQTQAANLVANASLADVSSGDVENAIQELEGYLKQNRSGTRQYGDIGVKAGFAIYRRWNRPKEIAQVFQPYIGIRIAFIPSGPPPSAPPRATSSPFKRFKFQTGTLLHPTDATFAFAITDWNGDGVQDLVAIKKSGTGTGSTEVHIFSGASNFRNLLLTAGTPLPETDETYDFALADWNGDGRPDLFAIQKSKTESGTTEVNILSGASNFQDWLLRKSVVYLPETDENTAFVLADWSGDGKPDLMAVKKRFTDTRLTEVEILSGKSTFQESVLRIGINLGETDANWSFAATKSGSLGSSRLDLVCINRAGQKSTEVGILSGRSLFQEFLVNGSTALPRTDATFDFVVADRDRNGRPDLVAIKKSGTDTRSTEVHVLGE